MADFTLPITTVNAPLSGAVTQTINPWTLFFNPMNSQLGLVNYTINLGASAQPAVEQAVLSEVASYGRQLGRIEDAFAVLLKALDGKLALDAAEAEAIDAFRRMMAEIAAVKRRHRREVRQADPRPFPSVPLIAG